MNRENWVSKLHDYTDEEGYNEVCKLIADIELKLREEIFNEIYERIEKGLSIMMEDLKKLKEKEFVRGRRKC